MSEGREREREKERGMLEELVAGGAEGLVLLQDSVSCEGHTLLKSFVAASARRGESVHVINFDIPEEEFKAGFTPDVASQLFIHDGFRDPLGWTGARGGLTVGDFSAPQLVLRFSQAAQGPATLVLDSLSWLLLRLPFPSVCQVLAQLPKKANTAGVRIRTLVALLHGDLHPPEQLKALHSLARVVVTLKQGDGSPRVAVTLHRKRRNKVVQKKEYFTVLSGFALKHLGEPSPAAVSGEEVIQKDDASAVADPTANLTFNLRLSEAERRAKESVPLPYQFSEEKKSSLLQGPTGQGKIYYEPDAADDIDDEDPDDDLDV
ncbi:elongator complex protein 5 isoform X1 [Anolis carolinensis]|uniref:elongator complex protein 5 isoform X1 n=1 Tax=Anolis carolinensis TaxID=28377 RepID=UPI002F2B2079